jgi:hypothetical protein
LAPFFACPQLHQSGPAAVHKSGSELDVQHQDRQLGGQLEEDDDHRGELPHLRAAGAARRQDFTGEILMTHLQFADLHVQFTDLEVKFLNDILTIYLHDKGFIFESCCTM